MEKSNPVLVSVRRLLRRARIHGHQPWIIKYEVTQAVALFNGRHIRVRDDGSLTHDTLPRFAADESHRADPHAMSAMFERQYHQELNWAGRCRQMGFKRAAKQAVMWARDMRRTEGHDHA